MRSWFPKLWQKSRSHRGGWHKLAKTFGFKGNSKQAIIRPITTAQRGWWWCLTEPVKALMSRAGQEELTGCIVSLFWIEAERCQTGTVWRTKTASFLQKTRANWQNMMVRTNLLLLKIQPNLFMSFLNTEFIQSNWFFPQRAEKIRALRPTCWVRTFFPSLDENDKR